MSRNKGEPSDIPGELKLKPLLIVLICFALFDITVYLVIANAFTRHSKVGSTQGEVDQKQVELEKRITNTEERLVVLGSQIASVKTTADVAARRTVSIQRSLASSSKIAERGCKNLIPSPGCRRHRRHTSP